MRAFTEFDVVMQLIHNPNMTNYEHFKQLIEISNGIDLNNAILSTSLPDEHIAFLQLIILLNQNRNDNALLEAAVEILNQLPLEPSPYATVLWYLAGCLFLRLKYNPIPYPSEMLQKIFVLTKFPETAMYSLENIYQILSELCFSKSSESILVEQKQSDPQQQITDAFIAHLCDLPTINKFNINCDLLASFKQIMDEQALGQVIKLLGSPAKKGSFWHLLFCIDLKELLEENKSFKASFKPCDENVLKLCIKKPTDVDDLINSVDTKNKKTLKSRFLRSEYVCSILNVPTQQCTKRKANEEIGKDHAKKAKTAPSVNINLYDNRQGLFFHPSEIPQSSMHIWPSQKP